MTKHGKAVANSPGKVLQVTAMLPLLEPALWANALD